jgi:RNA polymerase sigma-70 factor (ECF subfamily)
MLTLAQKLLGNREAAEDVVQSTFLVLLAKEQTVRAHDNPTAWLYVTLRNQLGNELQREKYRKTAPMDSIAEPSEEDTYHFGLSETLEYGLSEGELSVLSLFYENELSCEEIAARLGISVLACRTRLFRARQKYKQILEDKNNSETS